MVGYICRKLKKQFESSSHPNKEDIVLSLMGMCGDELDEEQGTEDWANLIDRGGLWHISDQALLTHYSTPLRRKCVLTYIQPGQASTLKEGSRQAIFEHRANNIEVVFQWCVLASDTSEAASKELFHAILERYMTIRGLTFASACVELHKQATHMTQRKRYPKGTFSF